MHIHGDFADFLRLLNEAKVDYVLVGGYAVAFHGYARNTKDLDILYRNSPRNILRLQKALVAFGIPTGKRDAKELAVPGRISRIGVAPVMVELINAVSGLTFGRIWRNRTGGTYGEVTVNYISLNDLLENKRASGRPIDLADVDQLSPD